MNNVYRLIRHGEKVNVIIYTNNRVRIKSGVLQELFFDGLTRPLYSIQLCNGELHTAYFADVASINY